MPVSSRARRVRNSTSSGMASMRGRLGSSDIASWSHSTGIRLGCAMRAAHPGSEASAMIHVSEGFRSSYPGAWLGLLAMNGVSNPSVDSQLEVRKAEVERELRGRYQGLERAQLKQLPTVQAYVQYY